MPRRIRALTGGIAAACALSLVLAAPLPLVGPSPVRAVNVLTDPSVSPNAGTTATVFTFSVVHASDPHGTTPTEVRVAVAGLTLPMTAIGGDATDGLIYQVSSVLPAGTWTATFSATVSGAGGQPSPVTAPQTIDVVPAVTSAPTPSPTAVPEPTPSPPQSALPTPTGSPAPTPAPASLPPGVTPAPTARATPLPPGSTPGPPVSTSPAESPAPDPSDAPGSFAAATPDASGDARSAAPASPASTAASPRPEADDDPVDEPSGGVGRLGWVVLGGMTSVAGAVVIVRQWRLRRAALPAGPGP